MNNMETIKYIPRYISGYYCVVSLVDDKWKVHEICSSKDKAEKRCNELNSAKWGIIMKIVIVDVVLREIPITCSDPLILGLLQDMLIHGFIDDFVIVSEDD